MTKPSGSPNEQSANSRGRAGRRGNHDVTANGRPETVTLSVDARGLIDGLQLAAAPTQAGPPVPATWSVVDKQVEQAAPQTRLLVAGVNGGACRPASCRPSRPGLS